MSEIKDCERTVIVIEFDDGKMFYAGDRLVGHPNNAIRYAPLDDDNHPNRRIKQEGDMKHAKCELACDVSVYISNFEKECKLK